MSDTPRSDAAVKQYDGSWFAEKGPAYDLLMLCRELERELAAVRKDRDEWRENTKSLLREKSVLDGVIESLKDLLRISSQESEK